jgi:hypothetical protein
VTAALPEEDPELYDAVRAYIHHRSEEARQAERQVEVQRRQMTYG